MSVFAHGAPNVAVVPVGDPPEATVECATDALKRELGITPTVFDRQTAPETEWDDGPVDSADLLGRTAEAVGEEFDLAIGVTDSRIKTLNKSGVFGVASAGGHISIVSTDPTPDELPADERERRQIEKLTLHQVGRLFGFEDHGGCVMQSADIIPDVDDRPASFCNDCTRRLGDSDTAPEPPEWHVVTEELEQFRTASRWAKGDIRLTEYPLFALGWFVDTLARLRSKLPSSPDIAVPRLLQAFIHESYRTIRFWVLVLTYFVTFALVVFAGFLGYEALAGSQPSDAVTWGIVILGLPTAYGVQLLARAIVAGLVVGVAEGTREGLRAEE
jgi:predicted Zn-dependent protease